MANAFSGWLESRRPADLRRCKTCMGFSHLDADFREALEMAKTDPRVNQRTIHQFAISQGYTLSYSSLARHLQECLTTEAPRVEAETVASDARARSRPRKRAGSGKR